MKTTSIFKITLFLLVILSTFACKGHKSGEDNQTTDTVKVAKDCTQFVLKHLDVDKKKGDAIRHLLRTNYRLAAGYC